MKKEMIFLILSLVLVMDMNASPEISGVDGSIASGNILILTGSGFGQAPTIYKWDDFEQGVAGNELSGWNLVSSNRPVYSDEYQREGSSISAYSDDATDDFEYSRSPRSPIEEFYCTFWMRVDRTDTPLSLYNHKWFKMWYNLADMDHAGATFGTLSSSQYSHFGLRSSTYSGSDCDAQCALKGGSCTGDPDYCDDPTTCLYSDTFTTPTNRVWQRFEIYFDDSSFVDGAYTGAYDGTLVLWHQPGGEGHPFVYENEGEGTVRTDCAGETYRIEGLAFAHFSRDPAEAGGPTSVWYDDILISSSRARVEIGDAPAWEDCTHREIQIPQGWSDGSISVDINQGSFEEGDAVYLFVVDENGVPSDGFGPFIFGQDVAFDGIAITSVSGPMDQGETVTIGGMNFGTKASAAPLKWDDFEQAGTGCAPGEFISNSWSHYPRDIGSKEVPVYDSYSPKEGSSKHILTAYQAGTDHYGNAFWYEDDNYDFPEVFVSFYAKYVPEKSPNQSGQHTKFFRLCYHNMADSPPSTIFVHKTADSVLWGAHTASTGETDPQLSVYNWQSVFPNDAWVRFDVYARQSTSESLPYDEDGYIRGSWLSGDGTKEYVFDDRALKTNDDGAQRKWHTVMFSEYMKKSILIDNIQYADPTRGGYWYWDDVYIDDTLARVEIGDAPVWEDCTRREIQIPQSWSDGSITFSVNQGSYHDGEDAYIFVVDENGDVSPGRPITFSGQYTDPIKVHEADTDDSGQIEMDELVAYIYRWKAGQVSMADLIDAIKIWKGQ